MIIIFVTSANVPVDYNLNDQLVPQGSVSGYVFNKHGSPIKGVRVGILEDSTVSRYAYDRSLNFVVHNLIGQEQGVHPNTNFNALYNRFNAWAQEHDQENKGILNIGRWAVRVINGTKEEVADQIGVSFDRIDIVLEHLNCHSSTRDRYLFVFAEDLEAKGQAALDQLRSLIATSAVMPRFDRTKQAPARTYLPSREAETITEAEISVATPKEKERLSPIREATNEDAESPRNEEGEFPSRQNTEEDESKFVETNEKGELIES